MVQATAPHTAPKREPLTCWPDSNTPLTELVRSGGEGRVDSNALGWPASQLVVLEKGHTLTALDGGVVGRGVRLTRETSQGVDFETRICVTMDCGSEWQMAGVYLFGPSLT